MKRMRWLAAAVMVFAAVPARAQDIPRISFEKYTLPNGLEVILHEDHSVPLVAVNTFYKVGSADEKPGRTGFAHLFEHIMFMGSENVPVGAFDQLLEAAGATNNGSTTEDRTDYYEQMPSNALPLALWLDDTPPLPPVGMGGPSPVLAHSVAAWLNANEFGEEAFGLTPDGVIALVQSKILTDPFGLKDTLEQLNSRGAG